MDGQNLNGGYIVLYICCLFTRELDIIRGRMHHIVPQHEPILRPTCEQDHTEQSQRGKDGVTGDILYILFLHLLL